jgi:hypothetical protein
MFNEYEHEEMEVMREEIFNHRWLRWASNNSYHGFNEEEREGVKQYFLNMKSKEVLNKYMTYEIALLVCIENYRRKHKKKDEK